MVFDDSNRRFSCSLTANTELIEDSYTTKVDLIGDFELLFLAGLFLFGVIVILGLFESTPTRTFYDAAENLPGVFSSFRCFFSFGDHKFIVVFFNGD